MSHPAPIAATLIALAIASPPLFAADNPELRQMQQDIATLRRDYEAQLKALEARLRQAEARLASTPAPGPAPAPLMTAAGVAPTPAAPATSPAPAGGAGVAAQGSASGFNPAIALILSGGYASLSRDPGTYRIAGFLTGGEIGPGARGFSLGESELSLSASIDPWFQGALNLALGADNTASVEEAYVQTTALPAGATLRAGRFLSGIGYNNEKHAHTWDFVDAPLAYQAFLGGALHQDGLQLRAVLPTSRFIEIGAEMGAAGPFPSAGVNRRSPGTAALFAHTGGDVGASHSWRAGLSMLWAKASDRGSDSLDSAGNSITHVFSGNSRLAILDGVWKWAPNGNPQRTNLTLQGEYFRRRESGELVYDAGGQALADSYRSAQAGWYAQAVYQFMPAWRVGLRHDRLDTGSVNAASNTANLALSDHAPTRTALMLDWAPSEFSRVRLQLARDRARLGLSDKQIMIQYQMSLGSHGAHNY